MGCNSSGEEAGTKRRAPHSKTPLIVATIEDPITFNPIVADDSTARAVGGAVFDTLLALDTASVDVRPNLAVSWHYNEDSTRLTLEVRDDVTWHDGVAFTADDVVFTINAIQASRESPYFHVLRVDRRRINASAEGPHRVRFTLPRANAAFLRSLVIPIIPHHRFREVVSREGIGAVARQWKTDEEPSAIIGTGPYRLDQYRSGDRVNLLRNTNYWKRDQEGAPVPHIEQYIIRIADSREKALDWFLAGATHLFSPRIDEIAVLEEFSSHERILQEVGLDTSSLFLTFNRNSAHFRKAETTDPRLNWFRDRRFLRAIAHSIDKNAIVEDALHGYGAPAVSYLPPSSPFCNKELTDYVFDPSLARRILEDAGYRDRDQNGQREDAFGNPIHFVLSTNEGNPLRQQIAKVLISQLAQVGIRVTLETLAFPALFERLDATYKWDAMLIGFTSGIDPSSSDNLLRSNSDLHVWNPAQRQPESTWERDVDRLIESGIKEKDELTRREIYWHIQEILHEELPMIHLVRPMLFAAHHASVENFKPSPWGFAGVEDLKLRPLPPSLRRAPRSRSKRRGTTAG